MKTKREAEYDLQWLCPDCGTDLFHRVREYAKMKGFNPDEMPHGTSSTRRGVNFEGPPEPLHDCKQVQLDAMRRRIEALESRDEAGS